MEDKLRIQNAFRERDRRILNLASKKPKTKQQTKNPSSRVHSVLLSNFEALGNLTSLSHSFLMFKVETVIPVQPHRFVVRVYSNEKVYKNLQM